MKFSLDPFYQSHLPDGANRVDAIMTVRATNDDLEAAGPLEFGLIVDCSGSMQGSSIQAAKSAARKLVAGVPDRVRFFVIAFNDHATTVVPLTVSSEESRKDADRKIASIEAVGGTAMSTALLAAKSQFSQEPGSIRLALMLTDGDNREGHELLVDAIAQVKGRFQCHARGVGDGWKPAELLLISNALLGESKALASGQDIDADMQATFQRALTQGAGDVKIRLVIPPKMSKLVSLRQVSPVINDLTQLAARLDDRTFDFPTGSWGNEERDFHAVFDILQPGAIGEQVRICRTAIVLGQTVLDQPPVAITWSADASLTARLCPQVAHYTGQAELAEATREGLEALDRGDARTATIKLGHAAKIAALSDNEEATRRLAKVVDIIDQDAGTVRLRAGVAKIDLLDAEIGATRTVRVRKP